MSFLITFNETLGTLPKNQMWLQTGEGAAIETWWKWDGLKWVKTLINQDDINDLHQITVNLATEISNTAEQITLRATKEEVDEVRNELTQQATQITTTAEQLSIEVSRLEGEIGATSDELTMVKSHFDFTADGLRIRKPGSPMQVSISNEQIGLIDSGRLVAYINGQEMNITRAKVLQSLLVGTHVIEKYSDEITLIGWVG